MLKKLLVLFSFMLLLSTVFVLNKSEASELKDLEEEEISISSLEIANENVETTRTNAVGQVTESDNISPYFINDFRSRKKNVSYSESWSGYKRISDTLNTYNSNGGSITATNTASFGVTVSGSIQGLSISTAKTLTSTRSYTLTVAKNKKVYLGYRVKYKVETGTREYYDAATGRIISSNKYTVKTPISGEHKLVTVP